jgi:hypothetical protein
VLRLTLFRFQPRRSWLRWDWNGWSGLNVRLTPSDPTARILEAKLGDGKAVDLEEMLRHGRVESIKHIGEDFLDGWRVASTSTATHSLFQNVDCSTTGTFNVSLSDGRDVVCVCDRGDQDK